MDKGTAAFVTAFFVLLMFIFFLVTAAAPDKGCVRGHTEPRWFGQGFVCDAWEGGRR